MPGETVVLVTGSNRGIGLGLVKAYLSRPNHIVVAAVRDIPRTKPTFESITPASNSRVIVVRVDSNDRSSAKSAVEEIQRQGIDHLDIVIANAGVNSTSARNDVRELNLDTLTEHFEVNAIAPVALYQATRPLLEKSQATNGPIFVPMSSMAGSIGGVGYLSPFGSYGASKAALNLLFVRAHTEILYHNGEMKMENDVSKLGEKGVVPYETTYTQGPERNQKDRLAIIILHPGAVLTEMAQGSAEKFDLTGAVTVEESVAGMVNLLDIATQETHGGRFLDYKGTELQW